jgi:hypothetical protein
MPRLEPGLVRRSDLYGSAGWAYRRWRFLLAAGDVGRLDTLPWAHKGPTKQLVAQQRNPDTRQPSLFEEFSPDEFGIDSELLASDRELDLMTYVVAHSLDAFSGEAELVFGRPHLNPGGGPAWYWRENLLAIDRAWVPDAPVRLRRIEGGRSDAAS